MSRFMEVRRRMHIRTDSVVNFFLKISSLLSRFAICLANVSCMTNENSRKGVAVAKLKCRALPSSSTRSATYMVSNSTVSSFYILKDILLTNFLPNTGRVAIPRVQSVFFSLFHSPQKVKAYQCILPH